MFSTTSIIASCRQRVGQYGGHARCTSGGPKVRSVFIALTMSLISMSAQAEYPERPIRWIVPSAASGGSDAAARIVTEQLSKRLGQPIVIENRPGASGAIGLDALAKSAPDGYTLGTGNITNIVLNRQLRAKLPFDPDKDLIPVAKITTQPNVLAVNPELPVKNVSELFSYAKAHPKTLFYGSSGSGSSMHIAGETLNQVAGIDMVHVPYKSSPAANTDLIGNRIQVLVDNLSTLAPYVQSGQVRALAVTSPTRSTLLPQVPTMVEAGGPDFKLVVWGGVVAPTGVPPAIVKRVSDEIIAVLALPEVRQRLAELGYEADGQGPEEFGNLIREENERWGEIIGRTKIQAD